MSLDHEICTIARQVIEIECQAINDLNHRIGAEFVKACEILLNCKGHVVVLGIGKSGHVANKLAATLASTGTPAFFVHPSEASHGDLGMVKSEDVVIAISNSGNTSEILTLLPAIKYLKVPLISFTGNPESPIAKQASIHIDISVAKEACPLGLAPTASTTAALVMGDALAISLAKIRGFDHHDFALSHPGGTIGKKLLLKVQDLMHKNEFLPKVSPTSTIKDTLLEMTGKRLGMTAIVDELDRLVGIYTDGDLRRTLNRGVDLSRALIKEEMVGNCKTISAQDLAFDALQLMEKYNITALPVVDQARQLLGVVHIHDILKSGILPIN